MPQKRKNKNSKKRPVCQEVADAMEAGAKPITLGHRILRTETAGLAVLSVLMFQLEDE